MLGYFPLNSQQTLHKIWFLHRVIATCLPSEMLTNMLEKEEDKEEKERLREEIADLEDVLPDIIARVRGAQFARGG